MGGGGVALLECTHVPAALHEEEEGGEGRIGGKEGAGGAEGLAADAMYLLAVSKAGEVRVAWRCGL